MTEVMVAPCRNNVIMRHFIITSLTESTFTSKYCQEIGSARPVYHLQMVPENQKKYFQFILNSHKHEPQS